MWGANPAWSSQAQSTYSFRAMKEAGAKFIFVDPIYHDTAKVLGDQFIPCRPATDAALLLALAYVMITNNLQDQEFLDKYCIGFDAEHMPEGTDPNENYKDYVLGTYDGIPKTPEWASEICGTPVELIEPFAKEIATTKPMAFLCQRAPARTTMGEQFAQNFLTVGWMTGNVGKSGACVGHGFGGNKDVHGSGMTLVKAGGAGGASFDNPVSPYSVQGYDPTDTGDWTSVHMNRSWDAILDGEALMGVKGMQPIDIRMINNLGFGNGLNQHGGAKRGIEAHRKVEFVCASDFSMTTKCLYADIVLPIMYKAEEPGISATAGRRREMLLAHEQVIASPWETKTDIWVDTEIGKRLGISEAELMPTSELQQKFNTVAKATVVTENGKDFVPLFTITQADLDKYGVEGELQEGVTTLKDFLDRGCYQVEVKAGDNLGFIALKDYVDDPVNKSRADFTESGKLEIACPALARYVDACGYDEMPKSPIGKYVKPIEGYEDTFSNWASKTKGDYPLQLLTLHSWRSGHSWGHNYPLVSKAFPNDLLMNTDDARQRGVQTGDTVLISTKWGQSLRNVNVSERIMPGVIQLIESSWPTVDEETGIDKAGASNYLCGPLASGAIVQPWGTAIAEVEKWTGEPLEPDYKWLQRVVEV
jgi:anaerobic dimethyl sulfoxide reductase subunit A